jgi:5-formyltetrahydrofolate cyclo-ligase
VRGEIDTRPFHAFLRARGMHCLYPRVDPAGRERALEFFEVADLAELRPGAHGIAEPHPRPGTFALLPDVVLMPGVAFSEDAVRLGFGAGHFDATVFAWTAQGERPRIRLIGLAYDFQVVPKLPRENHDELLDFVVTETRVLEGKKP